MPHSLSVAPSNPAAFRCDFLGKLLADLESCAFAVPHAQFRPFFHDSLPPLFRFSTTTPPLPVPKQPEIACWQPPGQPRFPTRSRTCKNTSSFADQHAGVRRPATTARWNRWQVKPSVCEFQSCSQSQSPDNCSLNCHFFSNRNKGFIKEAQKRPEKDRPHTTEICSQPVLREQVPLG